MTDHELIAHVLGRFMSCDVANLATTEILAALANNGKLPIRAALDVVLAAVRGGLSDDVEDAGAEAYSEAREAHKVKQLALYKRMGRPMPKGADMCAPTHWLAPTIIAMLEALAPTKGKP